MANSTTPPVTPSGQENGDTSGQSPDTSLTPSSTILEEPVDSNKNPLANQDPPDDGDAPKYTAKDLNAIAAKVRREEQEKANRKKQEEQGEFEKLYQSEAQKAAALEQKILIRDICDELEIPKDWRDSVRGEDEDSIRESAETLKTRLDKIIAEAVTSNKSTKPGTPPPVGGGEAGSEDAEAKGKQRTKDLVLKAMGFQTTK